MEKSLWKVIGTRGGREFAVKIRASNSGEAVRKGSHAPHMLVVRTVILIEEGMSKEEARERAIRAAGVLAIELADPAHR